MFISTISRRFIVSKFSTTVIIIPSYNETLALPKLLKELIGGLSSDDAIIVVDDSSTVVSTEIASSCRDIMRNSECSFRFIANGKKTGRGAAIRLGMQLAITDFPSFVSVIECDADGSHQSRDILRLRNFQTSVDLVVGSRYLPESRITGWPVSRRIFSYVLNILIPKFLDVPLRDITNGLRKYSKRAVNQILLTPQKHSGFIFLSEQAVILNRSGFSMLEIPIEFIDRSLGHSTVTLHEVKNSIIGVIKLIFKDSKRD